MRGTVGAYPGDRWEHRKVWLQRRPRVVCLPCLGLVSRRPSYLVWGVGGASPGKPAWI